MRFCDAKIGEQQGSGFGLHRAAAVGMQGELAGATLCFTMASSNKGLNSVALSASAMHQETILRLKRSDDDIEIEVTPFHGPHQLGYVPGPNLIWAFGEKFR